MFFQIISGSYWSYIASLSIRNICFMYYYCPHFKSRVNIALLSFCSVLLPVVTSFTEKELIFFQVFMYSYLYDPPLLVLPSVTCLYLYCPLLGLLPSKYPLFTVLPSVFQTARSVPSVKRKSSLQVCHFYH